MNDARERRDIGFVEGPSIESTREFIRRILAGAGVQMLAVASADLVVGWCDIVRNPNEGFRHVGRLGMGLLPDYRGRGLGRRLAVQTIAAARQAGIERVELTDRSRVPPSKASRLFCRFARSMRASTSRSLQ
jgi:GNAT superfamily N-acetyltransferase